MVSSAVSLPVTDADGRIDNPGAYAEGWPVELSTRPLRLHTPQVEAGGLGGHCFSADFARYLASVKPRLVVGWQLRVAYWWASAYGRQRVARQFHRAFGPERGEVAYRAALALASSYLDYTAVIAATGMSANKLSKFVSLARRYASRPSVSAA